MVVLDLESYPLSITSTVSPEWGIVADYADDGRLHRRELFSDRQFVINANWDLLDLAKRDAIETLLFANRLQTFQIDFDGHRYTAELITPPARSYVAPQLYGITAAFRGTRGEPLMTTITSTSRTIAAGAITTPIYSVTGEMRITVRPGSGATVRVFKSSSPVNDINDDLAAGKLTYANFNAGTLSTLASGWFEWASGPVTIDTSEGVEDGDKWVGVLAISTGGSATIEVVE